MGNSSVLGLLFEINADPSKAEAALKNFEASTGRSFDTAARGAEDFGKRNDASLLNARESTRLLAEEFGIHLPRAVSGAIANILPNIAILGSGMLAIFAVQEVVAFVGQIRKVMDEFNGIAQAQERLKLATQESNSAMEEGAKKSMQYARQQIALLNLQISAAHEQGQASERAVKGIEIFGPAAVAAMIYYQKLSGGIRDAAAAEKAAIELEKLRDSVVKILGEDEAKVHKERKTRHAEEKSELGEITTLFRELSIGVLDTDASYRKYLETQAQINTLRAEWHRLILSELNDKRFRKEMAEEDIKLAKDKADWLFKNTVGLKESKAAVDAETEAHKRLEEGVKSLLLHSKELRQEWILSHTQLRMMTSDVHNLFIPAFQAAGATMQNFGVMGANALSEFERGMASNIAQAIVYQTSIGAAMLAALKSATANLAAEAMLQALKSAALGFYFLAIHDYEDASLAFKSAAIWGALGGAAAGVGAAIPAPSTGPGGTQSAGGTGASAAGAGAGVASSTPVASQPQQILQVIFQGPVYGGQSGIDELARVISEAVEQRDVKFTAYTVIRQPATRA